MSYSIPVDDFSNLDWLLGRYLAAGEPVARSYVYVSL